ncbi:OB-fold nucleic acid binding domain-containing protein [Candidatus Nanohalobium constans]|uniref:Archaea-specific RecJ-like exonuclease n=1 Tax=Candidatus Nanohalobium constans TaxID=2565781 RepID=A0A5Q0UEI1_9ARCH|nr:OB-fold nucleic acid binding domain-containing protein [Candidatus Nanohalobium constans]QGA79936.1 archaea-specific RecJ-like exonuclease [Candidatus Nanohalobium constans]
MNRERFTYLCLFLSVLGLGILQFSTAHLKPDVTDINSVDSSKVGQIVKVKGNVSGFYSTGSASFFTLTDSTDKIQVTSFNQPEVSSGDTITVLGKAELHQGSLQIVSTEIEQN